MPPKGSIQNRTDVVLQLRTDHVLPTCYQIILAKLDESIYEYMTASLPLFCEQLNLPLATTGGPMLKNTEPL